MKLKSLSPGALLGILISLSTLFSYGQRQNPDYAGYLFAYFTGNGPGEEQIRFAISTDGFRFFALNDNEPVIASEQISTQGGVRDPHLLRGEDGYFYMVVTDLYVPKMGWQNTAMVLLRSKDLIHWTHSIVDVPSLFPENFGEVNRVWAPQTIYDETTGKYMLYWSMRHNEEADIIYYAYANDDFTGLATEPKQLLYKEGACIDGDIVEKDGKYYLFFKNEDKDAKGIMLAISDKINEGYEVQEGFVDQTHDDVEGSGTFKLIDSEQYILMYDVYRMHRYQFCESSDLTNFEVKDEAIAMNFHPRHGSVIPVTQDEMDALVAEWGSLEKSAVIGSANTSVKKLNVVLSDDEIYLPVSPDTDISNFDPQLYVFPGATASLLGAQDFSKGALDYVFRLGEKEKTIKVNVSKAANPIVEGYYADPEIIFSERDQKYYLYPTSDGFLNWSGTFFETFSSPDLIHWKNEGTILDLKKDVAWADRNAWAPTAIERKVGDSYKYYYYFTAAQKIGVAVADNPAGPFKDSGKALIDFKSLGVNRGQEIDPDVFHDPVSDKYYLYWGNGYMSVAELNDDMISIKMETLKVITPDGTFREGTEVFYREGKYYFMWSENDTRDPDYRVRYAIAKTPYGPLEKPENNLVIARDDSQQLYGTGHNSVIYSQKKDQWYIVYHRFTRPKGMSLGRKAGFHRETCIDPLNFDEAGNIIQVTPTLEGIIQN